ncbi:hypothetical protein, partial [Mesorhizobium sp. M2E.F.Ca.ET.154.01.1.1]|uniref:hypothetical protein n=1 Tax=Mesorhizobium sp. M2E.F.Ca.ET.154.01.1.1 TaxID=2500521 RepID=UPI001AED25B7
LTKPQIRFQSFFMSTTVQPLLRLEPLVNAQLEPVPSRVDCRSPQSPGLSSVDGSAAIGGEAALLS